MPAKSKTVLDNLLSIQTLLEERERLDEVINAAYQARAAKTQINKLIALYSQMLPANELPEGVVSMIPGARKCPECGKTFKLKGLSVHVRMAHQGGSRAAHKARAKKMAAR